MTLFPETVSDPTVLSLIGMIDHDRHFCGSHCSVFDCYDRHCCSAHCFVLDCYDTPW